MHSPMAANDRQALNWTLLLVAGVTAARLAALFARPIELYPEEAQYWLWSQRLDFGYFSKPPMIAWLIRAATEIGGQREPWVRLAAPVCHAIAAIALQRAGARLYDGVTGFWAAALYSLMPGVQLSAAVIATDAPLMAFAALALWLYAEWLTAPARRLGWAMGLGAALGLAALSKYAVLYLVIGLGLHAAVSPEVRRRWRPADIAAAVGLGLLVLSPNLVWNAAHGFQTVTHTAADAAIAEAPPSVLTARPKPHGVDPRQAPGFVVSQLGVFGPVPLVVLVVGAVLFLRRKPRDTADGAMLALAAPALAIILVEAVAARANANWAAISYLPAAVVTAAWLVRWRAWKTLGAAVASQALIAAVFLVATSSPTLADRMGLANSFKRARGWEAVAALVDRAQAGAGPLSAIAVDDRFTFNALAYYDRGRRAGGPPLKMWVREKTPHNEAESTRGLHAGARVLFVDIGGAYRQEAMRDFASVRVIGAWRVWTDPRHFRRVFLFVGEDFRPRPRDPATGLPIPV